MKRRKRPLSPVDLIMIIAVLGIFVSVLMITTSSVDPSLAANENRDSVKAKRDAELAQLQESIMELTALSANQFPSPHEHDMCGLRGLSEILIPRVPGTQGNVEVRDYLASRLRDLDWTVEFDTFTETTVMLQKDNINLLKDEHINGGQTEFSNVIGYSTKDAEKYVVLTAHFDSKLTPKDFLGAVDSAVPCTMILNMMDNLNQELMAQQKKDPTRGIIVVFFDGEEAFGEWVETDSVYGSTHLAEKWKNEGFIDNNIELFVLFDLIGASKPTFYNFFIDTSDAYNNLVIIEEAFKSHCHGNSLENAACLLETAGSNKPHKMFLGVSRYRGIEDDHKPFEKRGLRNIVHLIPAPFPPQWHRSTDDAEHLDCDTIHDLLRIFQVWIANMFTLGRVINM